MNCKMPEQMEQENKVLYTYPFPENALPYIFLIPMVMSMAASLFIIWSLIAKLLRGNQNGLSDMIPLLFVIAFLWLFSAFFLPFLNIYPSFWISQNGLAVRTIPFGWKFVPWHDVVSISPILFGRAHLVVLNHLTIVNRWTGFFLGWTLKPSFVIKRTLSNYKDAVKILKEKTVHN